MLDFCVDHCQHLILQAFRCHKQMIHIFNSFSHGQSLEYLRCFCSDFRISSHQRKICIQTGRFLIVVSGSDLCIIFHISAFFLDDLAKLGMNFITVQSVNHMTACIFQKSGPFDIILFIKTRFQLYQHKYFFTVLCCLDKSFHDFTLFSHTVESHFYGNYIFIIGSFMKHGQKRLNAFIWIREKTVFFGDLVKDRLCRIKLR